MDTHESSKLEQTRSLLATRSKQNCCKLYKIEEKKFETLDDAMLYAKQLGTFVTIKGDNIEICGKFGVDTVIDGVCPDGIAYDWKKRRK